MPTSTNRLNLPVPEGRHVDLPGRGRTFIREVRGPQGAPTLVLLHGLGATGALNWFGCFQSLGRHFRVVAVDQRGHGRGIRSSRSFRLEDCADDVAGLAEVLDIDSLIPVGYSMGGPVAQLVWRRYPDLVDGLVLCATSRNFRGSDRERLAFTALPGLALGLRLLPPAVRRQMAGMVLSRALDERVRGAIMDELGRNDPAAMVEAARAVGRFTSHDWIGEVSVPTAVVVMLNDNVVPPHRQIRLAESIPSATVHTVPGDHGVCASRPDLFAPVLLDACRTVARRAAAPTVEGHGRVG